MNTGLRSLTSNWFRQVEEQDMADEQNLPPMPPPIAMLPMPEPTDEERRLKVIADAHVYVAQLGQERIAKDKQIEQLVTERDEARSDYKKEQRKSGLLELDLAERDNTVATLQSDLNDLRQFFTLQVQINEKERQTYAKFGIKAAPKPERKPKKKTLRESAIETTKADG